MSQYVPAAVRRAVRERACRCCEYCLIHEEDCLLPHEPDHVVAVKHGGETMESNLAWTCFVCNRAKGSDIASIDPQTKQVVRLYSPRQDDWKSHFKLADDGRIIGLSPIGRVTVALLKMNQGVHVELRQTLMRWGLYPRRDDFTS